MIRAGNAWQSHQRSDCITSGRRIADSPRYKLAGQSMCVCLCVYTPPSVTHLPDKISGRRPRMLLPRFLKSAASVSAGHRISSPSSACTQTQSSSVRVGYRMLLPTPTSFWRRNKLSALQTTFDAILSTRNSQQR